MFDENGKVLYLGFGGRYGLLFSGGRSGKNAALSSAIWAALAAGSEKGGYDDTVLAAEKMGKLMDTVYVPNPEAKRRYDILYKEYIMLHDYFGRGGNNVMKRLKKTMSKI